MKAKQFVNVLWDLHLETKNSNEDVAKAAGSKFDMYMFHLKAECTQPLKRKLDYLATPEAQNAAPGVWEKEYTQLIVTSGVKWNAVAHGLAQRTEDRQEIFPYFHGGVIIPDLVNIWQECRNRTDSPLVVVGTFDFLRRVAAETGLSASENGNKLFNKTYIDLGEWILDSITANLGSDQPDRSKLVEDMQAAGTLGHQAMSKAQGLVTELMIRRGIDASLFFNSSK